MCKALKSYLVRELLFGCVVAGMFAIAHAESPQLTAETLPAARREAAARKRRVIMNNDGNDSRTAPSKDRAGFLQSRSVPLAGSQVDAIFYCTGIWGTFTHKSATAELRVGSDQGYQEWAAHLADDGGPDALGTIVDFGHRHGMEVSWSLRMNDTHDAGDPTMMSAWKKANPECLAGKWEDRGTYCGGGKRWSAVNYTHPLVRDRTVGWFGEVAENYDVDGVELDFFRHPVFFASTLHGRDATTEECEAMSSVVRRIRAAIDAQALRRGRPVLLAIRVPDSAGYCRALGLDVEQWLKEGLVDLMTVSGYFRLNPWQVSVELGRKYGVPVYAGLSESRFRDNEIRALRQSAAGYRGRAAEAWAAGAAGMYTFNLFNPKSPVFREIGDPVALAGMDKVMTTGARSVSGARSWMHDGLRFLNRPYPLPERPRKLSPGRTEEVVLPVSDRLDADKVTVTAALRVTGIEDAAVLTVSVNGKTLEGGKMKDKWVEYPVAVGDLRQGDNRIAVVLDAGQKANAELLDLLLWIRYPPAPQSAKSKTQH